MNLKNFVAAFFTAIVIAASVATATGGELTLKSVKENSFDLSARDGKTARKDMVGSPCALLRIELPIEKVSFEGNVLGDVPYKGNEHWVYVASGTKTIKIRANGFDTMTVDLTAVAGPKGVKGSTVYNIVIGGYESAVTQTSSSNAMASSDNYLVMNVTPKNAMVDIDNMSVSMTDGGLSKRFPYGTHTYTVRAPGYEAKSGSFEITSSKKTVLNVSLESLLATLTVVPQTQGATVTVEGQTPSTGQWSGKMEPGVYTVEVKKPGYRTHTQSVTLSAKQNRQLDIPALAPLYGGVDVNSTPFGADITIDGVKRGTTPDRFTDLLEGSHSIAVSKPGYATETKTVNITEGKVTELTFSLKKGDNIVAGEITPYTVKGVTFNMVGVEGGTFQMGSDSSDSEAYSDEKPRHSVTVKNFQVGQTEVTQGLWKAVMGSNPSNFSKGDNYPVESVSWEDCQTFLRKLNDLTGKKFRLLTEAEWEYAARGGRNSKGYKYSGSNNIGEVAWYTDNSGSTTHPVGTTKANELGIYDMTGNVWEWCQDWKGSYPNHEPSTGSYRVDRGGSWSDDSRLCRVANRDYFTPSYRYGHLGLRLAL